MWELFRRVPNLLIAEMWKDFLEGEGIPVRILPENRKGGGFSAYRIYIPKFRSHIAEEAIRKL